MTDERWEDLSEDEILALDLALDAVARQEPYDPDAALIALASFAQAIDGRAAALTARHASAVPNGVMTTRRLWSLRAGRRTPTAATGPPAGRPDTPPPARSGRTGRARRRLVAIPLIACLALAIAVPNSTSPEALLYPLHQLLFDRGQSSAVETVRLHLTNARRALDRAAAAIGLARVVALDDARHHLTEARRLIPRITDAPVRLQLGKELDDLDRRADQLTNIDQPGNTTESNDPNDQNGQRIVADTNGPQDAPPDANHGITGLSGAVPNDHRHGLEVP